MARRLGGDAKVENGKKKEEDIDIYRTVYIDTNLDTHLALVISEFDSVLDLKKKVMLEHLQCFPKLGEILIHALKVKRKGHFYHLSDSMRVSRAFEGVKNSWFLSVDASYLKKLSENEQSCRPNMSNQLPMFCLPYNLTNTGCNNDDASTSSILKLASVVRLSNQKVQPIPGDSCREFSEDVVTNHKCSSTEILKNVSADLNRVPDLPTAGTTAYNIQCSNSVEPSPEIGLLVKNKKQKIKKHNADELGDCPANENIALNHVSGGDALCHEILLSANMLVHLEKAETKEDALQENRGLVCNSTQKTSKQESILPEVQYTSQIIASNTVSPESTDTDHLPISLRLENMKSKKKKKGHEMNLLSADNHERASFSLSVEDSAIEDRVKEKNIPSSPVTGEVERKTSKQKAILPEDQYNSQTIASNTMSPESTDTDQMTMSLRIENMKSKKKRKRHEMNSSSAENHEKASFVLSVKDSFIEDRVKEKNIPLNHVTGEVLSPPEILDPSNLLVNTERKEHNEIEDPLKENKVPVSTSKEVFELPRNSAEQNNSPKIVLDTLSSEPADNQHLRTSPGIKSKRGEKKRKKDVTFNLPSVGVLPSSVQDAVGEESLQEKNIASNHVSGENESHYEVAVRMNLVVNAEMIERGGQYGDSFKENKVLVSTNETSPQEIGLTDNSMEDRQNSQKIVVDSLSSAAADNEHLRTDTGIKSKKDKKKRKTDAIINISNSIVLPSSARDTGGAESLNDKKSASNYVSAEDEARPESAVLANSLVDRERIECEKIRDSSEQDKNLVSSSKKTSTRRTGVIGNNVEDQRIVAFGTLSPAPAESERLRTSSSIKHNRSKKKSKRDTAFSLSTATVLPSSAQDVGEESCKEKNIALNNASGKDESLPKIAVPANLLVNTERTEHGESSGDHLEQNSDSISKCKNTSTQESALKVNSVQDQDKSQKVVLDTLSPELADSEHLGTNSNIKKMKKKKKRKMDAAFTLSSANVLPSSVQDAAEEESLKEKNIPSHEDESHHEIVVPANLLVNAERPEREEISGDPLGKDKVGFNATSTTIGLNLDGNTALTKNDDSVNVQSANMIKDKSRKDQANFNTQSQPAVSDTLSPELADSEHLGTNSNIKKMKKKKKRKMDAAFTSSSVNVLPSSVQDAAEEESLKEKNIPSHKVESHHEIVVPANLLVNAERPEREEISGDPLVKDKVGFNATNTTIGLNLDGNTALTKNDDSVNVQSANMIKDKSRKDQANFNTQSQPEVSESGSDRIDFKHYFLPKKAEDKVTGSDKNGITRSEWDDKTKKSTNKMTASLITSHDHALTLQSSENHKGGVKSHIKCSSDVDPQESFPQDASSRSLRPSKKSISNAYQKGLPSSFEPDQARTPHSVLRAGGRGVSVNSTPAPAYRKGKKVSSAASSSSSSSESFDKSHQGTKSKNCVSSVGHRLVACAKGSAKGTSEVKSMPPPRKSLLNTPGFIFKDDSSESSDDERASEHFNARTLSDDVLSSDSDGESEISLDSPTKGSSGLDKKEDVENVEKKRSSNLRPMTLDMILRNSSRYKKAKLMAESQPEVEDSESQPVDCVPDSQANP